MFNPFARSKPSNDPARDSLGRLRKGHSGNPKGRPKALRAAEVEDDGFVSASDVLRGVGQKAARGSTADARLFLEHAREEEQQPQRIILVPHAMSREAFEQSIKDGDAKLSHKAFGAKHYPAIPETDEPDIPLEPTLEEALAIVAKYKAAS